MLPDQQSAGGERVVANHLGIHAEARAARQQPVVGILLQLLRRRRPPLADRWRDVTISLKSLFTSQPDSRNSTASQSSSSGCDGASPCDPKSSAVFTMPVPKTLLPKAIHGHARREGIRFVDQPLRQAEPVSWEDARHWRKRGRNGGFHFSPG